MVSNMETQIPLNRILFNMGRDYYSGANYLMKAIGSNSNGGSFMSSAVLCANFSIEILLKCLQIIHLDDIFRKEDFKKHGISNQKHDYCELFQSINKETQECITNTYNTLYHEQIDTTGFLNLLKELGSDNFVKWRYVYESNQEKHFDGALAEKIANSLGKSAEILFQKK